MALQFETDGSIKLRNGEALVVDHLSRQFGAEPRVLGDRIGGVVGMVAWEYTVDGVGYATVASDGFERVPFSTGSRTEVMAEVRADQLGAAAVAVRLVVERAVEELQSPWDVGRVWINTTPFLAGTRMQGLVADDSAGFYFDAAGNAVGRLQLVSLLTEPEARTVAIEGLDALTHARMTRRAELADVDRTTDLFELQVPIEPVPAPAPAPVPTPVQQAPAPAAAVAPAVPVAPATPPLPPLPPVPPAPQATFTTPTAPAAPPAAWGAPATPPVVQAPVAPPVPQVPAAPAAPAVRPMAQAGTSSQRVAAPLSGLHIMVSKQVWQVPVGWIEVDEHGRFLATTQTETPQQLDDPNNLELTTLDRVVALNPSLEEFVRTAVARDFATWDANSRGWYVGRF